MARLDFIANGDNLITSQDLQFRVMGNIPHPVNSIEIQLYQTNSDPNCINKVLGAKQILYGTLREDASVLTPTILIASEIMFRWNYVYIPSTERYYFITDIKIQHTNLYEISLKCDVLMSYKDAILNMSAYVLRSASKYDWDITDTMPPAKSGSTMGRYGPTSRNGVWTYLKNNLTWDASNQPSSYGHLLIKLACTFVNDMNTPPKTIYAPLGYTYATLDFNSLATFVLRMRSSGMFSGDYKLTDFILDIRWIPCHIGTSGGFKARQFLFGHAPYFNIVDVADLNIRAFPRAMRERETVTWTFSGLPIQEKTYRNHPPFKTMAINFTPFGQIPIDSQTWGAEDTFYIIADIDSFNGDAILYIKGRGGYLERLSQANVAIPFDLVIQTENGRSIAQAMISGIGALASAPLSLIPGLSAITSKDRQLSIPGMIGGAVGNLVSGVSQIAMASTMPPSISRSSGSGGNNANFADQPELLVGRHEQNDPDMATQGWLLNKTVKLSTLHGYCLVAPGVHIENQLKYGIATKTEMEEIEALLTSGVILP